MELSDFCEKFGENQSEYQNAMNYKYTPNNQRDINELIQIITKQINNAWKFFYVDHQKKKHNNIPLWVLIKTLSDLFITARFFTCNLY